MFVVEHTVDVDASLEQYTLIESRDSRLERSEFGIVERHRLIER